jgi:ParB-like chromosome segregation protein Spo0J
MPTHHPDAALFPMLSQQELADLADDIKANGLHEPIKLDHTGEILVDGRNRERACHLAGIEPGYETLPSDIDIFAYIISTNLRRRHLTDEQRRAIILKIKERNPDISNRQIAKLADVHQTTVNRALSCSTEADAPVERKTKGKDGKRRPASNRVSDATKAAITADLKNNPVAQRDIALKHGVSVGTVAGIKNRLKEAGELRSPIAEHLARRAVVVPRYDTMTREERGMGSREYGAEQHPDYPEGWTRDHVHREQYGRIQIFTPKEHAERELVKQFQKVIQALAAIVADAPQAKQISEIGHKSREMIEFQLSKFCPRVMALLSAYSERIVPTEADKAS